MNLVEVFSAGHIIVASEFSFNGNTTYSYIEVWNILYSNFSTDVVCCFLTLPFLIYVVSEEEVEAFNNKLPHVPTTISIAIWNE